MKIKCDFCGSMNDEDSNRCSNCGAPLSLAEHSALEQTCEEQSGKTKIKDSFWLGLLAGAASFGLFFFLLSLIPWGEQYGRAPYLLAFIPGIVLFRMLLVKWNYERIGKGILLVTVIGMLFVFFLYKV